MRRPHRRSLPAALALSAVAACAAASAQDGEEWNPAIHDTVGAAPITLAELAGTTWLVEDIDRRGVLDRLQSRVSIAGADAIEGFAGCNTFRGPARSDAAGFTLGPFAATRKQCTPAVMDQERRVLDALGRARRATTSHGLLYLRDDAGSAILRLSRITESGSQTRPHP